MLSCLCESFYMFHFYKAYIYFCRLILLWDEVVSSLSPRLPNRGTTRVPLRIVSPCPASHIFWHCGNTLQQEVAQPADWFTTVSLALWCEHLHTLKKTEQLFITWLATMIWWIVISYSRSPQQTLSQVQEIISNGCNVVEFGSFNNVTIPRKQCWRFGTQVLLNDQLPVSAIRTFSHNW